MSEFLLEIFSEEIPSLMQKNAAKLLKEDFILKLKKSNICYTELSVFYGPRRISIYAHNINNNSYTEDKVKTCLINIIKSVLSEYSWPKSLSWNNTDIKWARPIRNISCLFNGEVLKFAYYNLRSNNYSYGHRSSNNKIFFHNFAQYCHNLEKNSVIWNHNHKKELVERKLLEIAQTLKLNISYPARLLEEVLGRVEYPVVLLGKIKEKFLTIAEEIIQESMIKHQKYFPLKDHTGKLASYFLFVSNVKLTDYTKIISSNEQILESRLEDSLFFYTQDLAETSKVRLNKLKTLNFHPKLGNFYEKSLRLIKICEFLSKNNINLLTAANFCKSDLVSNTVQEFPNLQATIGYYLLLTEDYSYESANIIKEHYKPIGEKTDLPSTKDAALLAIADKMDNIVGISIAGEKFSGSKDPFAIRRQIISIIKIILNYKLEINLYNLIKHNITLYQHNDDEYFVKIVNIFIDKIYNYFKRNYKIFACKMLYEQDLGKSLVLSEQKLLFLTSNQETIHSLAKIYKRSVNLIPQNIKLNTNTVIKISKISTEHFEVLVEDNKFSIRQSDASSIFESNLIKLLTNSLDISFIQDYKEIFALLFHDKKTIEEFLDNSLINTSDTKLYNLRVGLLLWINHLFAIIGNFTNIKN